MRMWWCFMRPLTKPSKNKYTLSLALPIMVSTQRPLNSENTPESHLALTRARGPNGVAITPMLALESLLGEGGCYIFHTAAALKSTRTFFKIHQLKKTKQKQRPYSVKQQGKRQGLLNASPSLCLWEHQVLTVFAESLLKGCSQCTQPGRWWRQQAFNFPNTLITSNELLPANMFVGDYKRIFLPLSMVICMQETLDKNFVVAFSYQKLLRVVCVVLLGGKNGLDWWGFFLFFFFYTRLATRLRVWQRMERRAHRARPVVKHDTDRFDKVEKVSAEATPTRTHARQQREAAHMWGFNISVWIYLLPNPSLCSLVYTCHIFENTVCSTMQSDGWIGRYMPGFLSDFCRFTSE